MTNFDMTVNDEATDRRRFKRATTIFNGRLYRAADEFPGIVLDLSVSGVKIKTHESVPLGEPVTLTLAGKVHFGGEVVWRKDDTMGVAFSKEPAEIADLMAAVLPASYLEERQAA